MQNESALTAVLAGHDAVIHSVKFLNTDASKIVAATKMAKVPRLLVVGGAGSLEVSPGLLLVNSPDFPAEYKPETVAGVEFLNALRKEKELDWTFLSPSVFFAPGERHRQVSTRQRPTFGRCRRSKPHIHRRLCDRTRG